MGYLTVAVGDISDSSRVEYLLELVLHLESDELPSVCLLKCLVLLNWQDRVSCSRSSLEYACEKESLLDSFNLGEKSHTKYAGIYGHIYSEAEVLIWNHRHDKKKGEERTTVHVRFLFLDCMIKLTSCIIFLLAF